MQLRRDHIQNLIDEPYYSRGYDYFQNGMVQLVSVVSNCVKARVVGNRVYNVILILKNSELDGECTTCPAYEDFGPCKHMAATAFAVMAARSYRYNESEQCASQVNEHNELKKILRKKTKEELISIIFKLTDDYSEIIDVL
jgi:uncharacterized Zn finger protein